MARHHPTITSNLEHLRVVYNTGVPVPLVFDTNESMYYAHVTRMGLMVGEGTLLQEPTVFIDIAADIVRRFHDLTNGDHHQPRLTPLPPDDDARDASTLHGPSVQPPLMDRLLGAVSDVEFTRLLNDMFASSRDNPGESGAYINYNAVDPNSGVYRRWRKCDGASGAIGSTCLICRDDFKSNEKIRIMHEKCTYHEKCISEWFKYKPLCPNCNKMIV